MKKNKLSLLVVVITVNILLLAINYPFECSYNNICKTTTWGYLLSLWLAIPTLIFNFGLLYYFWRKTKISIYTIFTGLSILYLFLPFFVAPLRHLIGVGFDIEAADRGIYPTFLQMAASSYLSLLRLLIPLNVLFVYCLCLKSNNSKKKSDY